jgi:hypothetical protein
MIDGCSRGVGAAILDAVCCVLGEIRTLSTCVSVCRAIIKWMKTMGQRLFSGNVNVLNTPFPVDMFEARSYMEKLADVWVYPRFLKEAALAPTPLERMRLTITWFIAGERGRATAPCVHAMRAMRRHACMRGHAPLAPRVHGVRPHAARRPRRPVPQL